MEEYNHTLTSPLIAITSALAAAAWLILFIGACVAAFHGVAWWIIIFELVVVVGTIVLLGINKFGPYRNMAYLLMAISLVYLTWLCQYTLDRNAEGGARAAAAGSVILIIVQFIWALELTAPGGGTRMSGGSWGAAGNGATNFGQRFTNAVRPAGGAHHGHHGHHNKNYNKELPRYGVNDEESIGDGSSVGDFEQATALHSCKELTHFLCLDQASAEDPNELSFSKNEVLDILDKRGNWWQARKQDGTTGIVPSNYFQ
ncbi:High osmolarity signaling protein sho1 [Choanephora cucurbitarum]|uniref:High osmolarity signaling protein sho1 n=1 Tax=Choanephora cucurbitarum TaxID=101091 RepID=A0A1C7N9Y8_9FUNG|nr:High osmolarity signaling protein sho1 [Choanephora cucurbitarum]